MLFFLSIAGEKKKLQSKLFTRSKEDQERILADKVANILMSNDSPVDLGLESPENVKSKIQSKFKAKVNTLSIHSVLLISFNLYYILFCEHLVFLKLKSSTVY